MILYDFHNFGGWRGIWNAVFAAPTRSTLLPATEGRSLRVAFSRVVAARIRCPLLPHSSNNILVLQPAQRSHPSPPPHTNMSAAIHAACNNKQKLPLKFVPTRIPLWHSAARFVPALSLVPTQCYPGKRDHSASNMLAVYASPIHCISLTKYSRPRYRRGTNTFIVVHDLNPLAQPLLSLCFTALATKTRETRMNAIQTLLPIPYLP